MTTPCVQTELVERTTVLTLNRPQARNAINGSLLTALRAAMADADVSPDVDVIVLTGADPAFCAGIDLKALPAGDPVLAGIPGAPSHRPWPLTTKPVIGAINGAAVTGGLELALACDFLVASERATFADTHARVGVMPCWGLTVGLPSAVGLRTAMQMSLTGVAMNAHRALEAGLVVDVVSHEHLLEKALALSAAISSADQGAARCLLGSYRDAERSLRSLGYDVETRTSWHWSAQGPDLAEVERRREAIIARGRSAHSRPRKRGGDG